jgi:hypothetical protein
MWHSAPVALLLWLAAAYLTIRDSDHPAAARMRRRIRILSPQRPLGGQEAMRSFEATPIFVPRSALTPEEPATLDHQARRQELWVLVVAFLAMGVGILAWFATRAG